MNGKRGMELSINMFVIILLSLVILGVGFALFAQGADSIKELSSDVDAQNQATLNRLLDDGSILVVPFTEVEAKRGELALFTLGVTNELQDTYYFVVLVSYAGSTAYPNPDDDPFDPVDINTFYTLVQRDDEFCVIDDDGACASDWVLLPLRSREILRNERDYFNIGIDIPRKNIAKGQYFFNIDVCYYQYQEKPNCVISGNNEVTNRYGTRQRVAVIVE